MKQLLALLILAWSAGLAMAQAGKDTTMPDMNLPADQHPSTYTIDDVQSVTTRWVDPIPAAADDEYTEYRITLKDGGVRIARISGMLPRPAVEKTFRETGYVGSVDALMAHK